MEESIEIFLDKIVYPKKPKHEELAKIVQVLLWMPLFPTEKFFLYGVKKVIESGSNDEIPMDAIGAIQNRVLQETVIKFKRGKEIKPNSELPTLPPAYNPQKRKRPPQTSKKTS